MELHDVLKENDLHLEICRLQLENDKLKQENERLKSLIFSVEDETDIIKYTLLLECRKAVDNLEKLDFTDKQTQLDFVEKLTRCISDLSK